MCLLKKVRVLMSEIFNGPWMFHRCLRNRKTAMNHSRKKVITDEEKEEREYQELEDALAQEEKEQYYIFKEAYKKIIESRPKGMEPSRNRLKLEEKLLKIVQDIENRINKSAKQAD